jgi:glycerate kinase
MKITVAIDSFKGSLTTFQAGNAIAEAARSVFNGVEVSVCPLADGGEGTMEAIVLSNNGEFHEADVSNPLGKTIKAKYGIIPESKTAVIEMATAAGLTLIEEQDRNPLYTTTYGVGQLILDAMDKGCRKFIFGIGGSATNAAGVGMLRALGFRFLDAEGRELVGGGEILERIVTIEDSGVLEELSDATFTVACDVTNPLYGPAGAAYVFAPQKGADAAMVERLDVGLRNFAEVVKRYNGERIAALPGAGAAGGLGGGFKALLGARLDRGIEMVLTAMQFDKIIEGSDLVVTGEGRLDRQTVMGKAPSGVLRMARKMNIPCVAIGGAVEMCDELAMSDFVAMLPILSAPMSLERAMEAEVAKANVERTATQIARLLKMNI